MLNPKLGVFSVSFLSRLIPATANVPVTSVSLTAIHVGLIPRGSRP